MTADPKQIQRSSLERRSLLQLPRVITQLLTPSVFLAISFLYLLRSRLWPEFSDESDNFLGGHLISNGYRLYSDYFSHHMPVPYYVAAVPSGLGIGTVEGYRVFTALMTLIVWALIIYGFRRRLSTTTLCIVILTSSLGHPLFWGHMLLAEQLFAYSILVLVLYWYTHAGLDFRARDQAVIAVAIYTAVMSILLSVYPIALLFSFYCLQRIRRVNGLHFGTKARKEIIFAGIISLPFLVTLIVFLYYGMFSAFIEQAFLFNAQYYSRFSGISGSAIDDLRMWLFGYSKYIHGNLNPASLVTLGGFLVVANILASMVLAKRRGIGSGITYYLVVGLTAMRGLSFHGSAYYVLSFLSVAIVLEYLWQYWISRDTAQLIVRSHTASLMVRYRSVTLEYLWQQRINPALSHLVRATPSILLRGKSSIVRLIAILGTVSYVFLAITFYVGLLREYPTFDQNSYPRSPYTDLILAATERDDRIWLAPLYPYGYLEASRLPATKYAFYLPWMALSPEINREIVADLRRVRPPIVVFEGDKVVWSRWVLKEYGREVYEYLLADYAVMDAKDPVQRNVYLRKDDFEVLLSRMRLAGLSGPDVLVVDYELPSDRFHHGDVISIKVGLRLAGTVTQEYVVAAYLREVTGRTWSQTERKVGLPTNQEQLQRARVLEEDLALLVDGDIPAGVYQVEVFVFSLPSYAPVAAVDQGSQYGERLLAGRVLILAGGDVLKAGQVAPSRPLAVSLDQQITLRGYDLPTDHVRPGETMRLVLYWEAVAVPREDYTVFVHLVDSQGRVVAQSDGYPLRGGYPTSLWQRGDLVRDAVELRLPANMAPGAFRLLMGMYLLQTMKRLPVLDEIGKEGGDSILVGTVVVDAQADTNLR